jgi:hypothetical protein
MMKKGERELRKMIAKELNAKDDGREVMTEEERKIRKKNEKEIKKKVRVREKEEKIKQQE